MVLDKISGRGVTSRLGLETGVPVAVKLADVLAVVAENVAVADSAPMMEGVTIMDFWQVPPGARIRPEVQLFAGVPESEKSPALVPEKVVTGLDMVMLVEPVLVMRKVSTVLAVP